ncbi:MAG: hypothetical protein ABS81_01810 [Pseudonocardia sp. SCN 72-86]|nr:MAG: hypothetical protein ABS81_01810 [Pseudonocardia sp. SCN 72-86]
MKPPTGETSCLKSQPPPRPGAVQRILRAISFKRISAVYVWIALIILFGVLRPESFLRFETISIIGSQQAVTALAALGLVLPLAVGAYDLSVGSMIGLASAIAGYLMVNAGVSWPLAVLVAVVVGVAAGSISGLLIVKARIHSLIATLGMSSLMLAALSFVTGDQVIVGLPAAYRAVAGWEIAGIPGPLIYVIVFSLIVWYVLQMTPLGRQIYATGGGRDAAKLAGVDVDRLTVLALAVAGACAALAGILLLSKVSAAQPGVGPEYLLPAFAAVFLGSTQFGSGRFNVWGTIVAVYVLGTGVYGIQLLGGEIWISNAFNGVALLAAVGLAAAQRSRVRGKKES